VSLKMANSYGISEQAQKRIRARDKRCVYCRVTFNNSSWSDSATVEHFKTLLEWFDSSYCKEKRISQRTVAEQGLDILEGCV
jgi:hypothetical protein